jgi:hypothetical protein
MQTLRVELSLWKGLAPAIEDKEQRATWWCEEEFLVDWDVGVRLCRLLVAVSGESGPAAR